MTRTFCESIRLGTAEAGDRGAQGLAHPEGRKQTPSQSSNPTSLASDCVGSRAALPQLPCLAYLVTREHSRPNVSPLDPRRLRSARVIIRGSLRWTASNRRVWRSYGASV
jgi:hypothetical protein